MHAVSNCCGLNIGFAGMAAVQGPELSHTDLVRMECLGIPFLITKVLSGEILYWLKLGVGDSKLMVFISLKCISSRLLVFLIMPFVAFHALSIRRRVYGAVKASTGAITTCESSKGRL